MWFYSKLISSLDASIRHWTWIRSSAPSSWLPWMQRSAVTPFLAKRRWPWRHSAARSTTRPPSWRFHPAANRRWSSTRFEEQQKSCPCPMRRWSVRPFLATRCLLLTHSQRLAMCAKELSVLHSPSTRSARSRTPTRRPVVGAREFWRRAANRHSSATVQTRERRPSPRTPPHCDAWTPQSRRHPDPRPPLAFPTPLPTSLTETWAFSGHPD